MPDGEDPRQYLVTHIFLTLFINIDLERLMIGLFFIFNTLLVVLTYK